MPENFPAASLPPEPGSVAPVPEQNLAAGWAFGDTSGMESYKGMPFAQLEAAGGLAVAHSELAPVSTEEFNFAPSQKENIHLTTKMVDGISFQTDLPEGAWPFEPTEHGETPAHPARRAILPSAIDSMPVGEFHIANPDTPDMTYARKITITEDAGGKYINQIADMGLIKNAGNTEGLMTALGYKFDHYAYGSSVEAAPSPATIQKNAAKLNVNIQFFDDQTLIDGKSYLEAFVDGKFPVSTASAEYYLHDTRDDHLTAMVIGGEPLKNALRDAAKHALETGANTDEVAKEIDDYTAYLRGAVSPTHNNLDHPYSDYEVRTIGERIGIDGQTTGAVLATARANAEQWGMKLNPVPVSLQKAA